MLLKYVEHTALYYTLKIVSLLPFPLSVPIPHPFRIHLLGQSPVDVPVDEPVNVPLVRAQSYCLRNAYMLSLYSLVV